MKKDLLLLLSLMLLLSVSAIAGPRSYQQAKAIAQRQAAMLGIEMDAEVAASAKAAPRMSVSSAVSPSATCYYVFANGEDKGFTIVSGDDRMPEVVGYSAQGTYDPDHLPANYVGFMKAYQETVEALLKGDAQVSGGLAEARQWRAERAGTAAVAPLLGGIKWNQGTPYNNMCPLYKGTNRSVTGCVATAMAQVMMYYQYPKELKATIKAYTAKSYGIQIPEISSGATYDWDNMLPDYSKSDYSSAQADAVAKLMYHCGAAVKMNYGPSSGANVTPIILATYFGYDADLMQDLTRTVFTLQQWMTLIDNELKAKRPILYSGQASDGGHEFVCDGSDGNGLYHINWGWGGYQDGYFDLTILQPTKGGAGSGSAVDGYNRDCSMIIGIAPDNGKVDKPLASYPQIMSLNYSGNCGITWTKTTRAHDSENFQAEATTCFSNQSTTAFSGYFAYGIKMANGTIARVSDYNGLWKLPAVKPDGGTYGHNPTLTINYPFPRGINVIYPIYSSDTKNWHVCSFSNNQPFIINVDATKLTPVTTPLTATVAAEEGLYTGMTNPLTVTFTNSMDMEFNGLVNIYTNTKDNTKPSLPDFDLYITIPARGSVIRQIELPETSSSQQYLWITDVANKEAAIVNGQHFTLTTVAAPNFTVVSSESNATPGKFGEGKYYENDYKLPLVEDDKLVVRFGVRNTGGPGYLDCCFVPRNANTMAGRTYPYKVRAAGNGAITYVEYTVTPEDVGNNSIIVYFNFYDFATGKWIDTPYTIPAYRIYASTGTGYKNLRGNALIAYVTGVPSSISSVKTDAGTYVRGEKGAVVIKTDSDKHLGVYHISGQKMAEVRLTAGQEQTVALRPGLYIVDGIKIMVR